MLGGYLERVAPRQFRGIQKEVGTLELSSSKDYNSALTRGMWYGEGKQATQQLFLRLLNFTPELLAKTQQEAKLQNTSFDAVIRAAVEKHLKDLNVARLREEEEKEAELR